MMFKPSKKVLELWEKYNEAYDAGDLEEYERLHAEYMKLYTKESDEFRSKIAEQFLLNNIVKARLWACFFDRDKVKNAIYEKWLDGRLVIMDVGCFGD